MWRFRTGLEVLVVAALQTVIEAQTRIDSISPLQGPIGGGTTVTLSGSGLAGATLTIDGVATTPVSTSDSRIVFQTPLHNNGVASIAVRGSAPAAYAEFLYLPPRLQDLPQGFISTIMGIGSFRGDGRLGKQAMYYADAGTNVTLGPEDAIYFSEPGAHVIRRVRPDGIVERYAGTGVTGLDSEGRSALETTLFRPRGVVFDQAGNLIFADTGNVHRIRRIDAITGLVTSIAGGVNPGFSGDGGPALQARFRDPTELAIDRSGRLYVLDFGNARIRRIDTNGIVSTIAGNGTQGLSGDGGPALEASFNVGVYDNGGLAIDSRGMLYLADTYNQRVRRIDTATGIITTFVANAGIVYGVAVDRADDVYVAFNNTEGARIRKFSSGGELLQTWGLGYGFTEDGLPAQNAAIGLVWRVAFDASGSLLFADDGRIRRINPQSGLLETLVGTSPHIIGETGSALATVLNVPRTDLLFLPTGELLTAEGANYLIRKTDRAGQVTVFAGSGSASSPPLLDGKPAREVSLTSTALALAPNGDVLAIVGHGVVRIDGANTIHTLTHLGEGFSGDGGPARDAKFLQPADLAVDPAGNIFIADTNNNRVRRIDAATGIITTVAGSGPSNGIEGYGRGKSCGDGGRATEACLNTPVSVAVGADQALYVSEWPDEEGARIRKIDASGTITTFVTLPFSARMRFHPSGNLFIGNRRIQPNGRVHKTSGSVIADFSQIGDGGPAKETICGEEGGENNGVVFDGDGNLYCSTGSLLRVRVIRYGAVLAEPGSSVSASAGTDQAAPIGSVFAMKLEATVRSPAGTLENGIRVDFIAPPSGPSCTFPSGAATDSVLTDRSGSATISCRANTAIGSFMVTATPLGSGSSAQFPLTNIAAIPRRRAVRH